MQKLISLRLNSVLGLDPTIYWFERRKFQGRRKRRGANKEPERKEAKNGKRKPP